MTSRLIAVVGSAAALVLVASPCLAFEYQNTPDAKAQQFNSGNQSGFGSTTSTDAFGGQQTTTHFGSATVTTSINNSGFGGYGYYGQPSGGYAPYYGGGYTRDGYGASRPYLGPNDPRNGGDPYNSMPSPYGPWPFDDR